MEPNTTERDTARIAASPRRTSQGQEHNLNVFLSYGHDATQPLAERLRDDLERHGCSVWFDRADISPGSDWEIAIEKGLESVAAEPGKGVVILLMTPHSVRRPDGYCLNEVTLAVTRRLKILPIMLVDVQPPLSITRTQWLDMRDCVPLESHEGSYEKKFRVLLEALRTGHPDTEGAQARLLALLRPIHYETEYEGHLARFTGRTWLLDRIERWLRDPQAATVFWLTGGPGSGKTAVSAWLCARHPDVAAYHFCRFDDRLKSDPAQAVRSIVWQLSTQFADYFSSLHAVPALEQICQTNDAATLFGQLVIDQLHQITPPPRPVIVVIDALDEATHLGHNELARLLAEEAERLPPWMRLFLTSRPDTEVTQQLQDLEPIALSAHSLQTDADVDLYLDKYLAPHAPGGVLPEQTRTRLLQVSEGNWLYLDWVRQELERGRLDLDQVDTFPRGLGGTYHRAFQRYFPDPLHYTETARPLLELVAAACQPLLVDHIGRILGWNPYQRVSNIRILGSLLDRTGGSVALFHRSARDWLADPERSGDYFVDPEKGHRVLAEAGWREFQVDFASMSAYMSRWLPTHLSIAKRGDDLVTCITDAPFIRRAFLEGRHFELTQFWQDAANHQFREACKSSYDKLADSGGVTADLYEAARAIGGLFQACGVYDEAIAYFERCLQLALQDSDPDKMGYAHLDIGWCARHMEDFQRALGHVESALEWFRTSGNRVAEGGAESIRGICLWHLQRDEDALEALTHARDLSSSVKDKRGEAEALNHMGIVCRGLGDYEEALRCLHAAEEFYAKVNDLRGSGKCCNSLGTAYWWSGEYAKALQCYDAADGYNTRTNQRYVTGLTANDRGYVYIDLGRYREALDAFTSARSIRQALGTEGYEMMDISGLALAHHYLGDHQVARSLSNQALARLRGITQIEDEHRAYFNHYLIHRNGSVEDQEAARKALAVAKQLVAHRIAGLANPNVRQRFIDQVPLVRQVLAS